MTDAGKPADTRLVALDATRGLAVLGILLLNIVAFALPSRAYVDPYGPGGGTPADWWAWAIVYVLADGKMRGLFAILFGASAALAVSRAGGAGRDPWRAHAARMIALLAIGMIHAWFVWSGDILVAYAICGLLLYPALGWSSRALLAASVLLLALPLAGGLADHFAARRFAAVAAAPGASVDLRRRWADWRATMLDDRHRTRREIAGYRGGQAEVQRQRAADTRDAQVQMPASVLPDSLALMFVGVVLLRSGFFAGGWRPRTYRVAIVAGAAALAAHLPIVLWLDRTRFDPVTLLVSEPLHLSLLRPWAALGYAAAVVLAVRAGTMRRTVAALAAAGRMAFTNYLGASVVATTIFYGTGLGLYARIERWALYPMVVAMWAVMLAGSIWWMRRFAVGPLEWFWRSLAAMQPLPFRRR